MTASPSTSVALMPASAHQQHTPPSQCSLRLVLLGAWRRCTCSMSDVTRGKSRLCSRGVRVQRP
eukprot:1548402-Rhodomonas_salina.2